MLYSYVLSNEHFRVRKYLLKQSKREINRNRVLNTSMYSLKPKNSNAEDVFLWYDGFGRVCENEFVWIGGDEFLCVF